MPKEKEKIENWEGKIYDFLSPINLTMFREERTEKVILFIKELLKFEKKKNRQKFIDALIWCSGSEDFQVGGKARKGWEKICLPLLRDEK